MILQQGEGWNTSINTTDSDESQCECAGSTFWHFVLVQSADTKRTLPGSSGLCMGPSRANPAAWHFPN